MENQQKEYQQVSLGDDDVLKGKPQCTPLKLIQTAACVAMQTVVVSMAMSMVGPSLVNLEVILDSDTATMGLALSLQGGGFLAGAFLASFIYDRFNSELQFFLFSLVGSLPLVGVTWATTSTYFTVLLTINGVALGFLSAGASAYILVLWHGHPLKDSLLQAHHLMGAAGAALGPVVISPFLMEVPHPASLNATSTPPPTGNGSVMEENAAAGEDVMHLVADVNHGDVEMVRYGYLLIGLLGCIFGALFGLLFIVKGCTLKKLEKLPAEPKGAERKTTDQKLWFQVVFIISLFLFFFLYVFIEGIPASFVPLFMVSGLGWPVQYGALAATGFWCSLAASRIINIPLSIRIRPEIIVGLNLILVFVASLCLMFFADYGGGVVTACVCVIGFGCGPIFAAQMLWASRVVPFTGATVGLCMIGNSLGRIVGLAGTGYLMENYGYMYMVYMTVLGGVAILALYIATLILTRLCGPRPDKQSLQRAQSLQTSEFLSLQSINIA